MTTQTVQNVQSVQTTGLAGLPRVNLMPPEIAEAERFRRVQLGMGAAVLASAVIVGGLFVHAKSGVSAAQNDLSAAQSQQTSLQSKLNSLSSVRDTYAAVQAKQTLLQQAMGQEIRWSFVLNDLALRIPDHVWLTSVSASESTAPGSTSAPATSGAPAPGAATATPGLVGTMTFQGVGFKHNDVAAWLDALSKEKGFVDPTFASSTEALIGTRKTVNFATSVGVTQDKLSNRFAVKAGK